MTAQLPSIASDRRQPDERSYTAVLDDAFDSALVEMVEEAEKAETFPAEIFQVLGRTGVFADKWCDGHLPDLAKTHALAERLGRLGSAGVGVGISLHDSAIAILKRFGRNDHLAQIADRATRGEAILCVGASEHSGGSDLQRVETLALPEGSGYRVRGRKKFVSLSPIAEQILVVARCPSIGSQRVTGDVAVIAVPRANIEVGDVYSTVGAAALDTAPIVIDTWVPADALVAKPGTGIAAISWGLAHERISIAAQIVSACELAIGVTVARMKRRKQFGTSLFEHQALRLRFADLHARVKMMQLAVASLCSEGARLDLRTAAAAKVTAARLGEEVISECMHIFGGVGYLPGQSPLGRWWRDMKLARVGGGADEVLWELVATSLQPDFDSYSRLINDDEHP